MLKGFKLCSYIDMFLSDVKQRTENFLKLTSKPNFWTILAYFLAANFARSSLK